MVRVKHSSNSDRTVDAMNVSCDMRCMLDTGVQLPGHFRFSRVRIHCATSAFAAMIASIAFALSAN